jgi:hypothetical protein
VGLAVGDLVVVVAVVGKCYNIKMTRNEKQSTVYLMMKDINPKKNDSLKNYYMNLIVPRGLDHLNQINIIAGPTLLRNKGTEIVTTIENENFKDLNYMVHLAQANPTKISFYLRNKDVSPYPFEFITHNYNTGICIVSDADSKAQTVVFNNPKLVETLGNIFKKELKNTKKINFGLSSDKKIVLNRMNLLTL